MSGVVLGGPPAWKLDLVVEVKNGSLEEETRLLRLEMRRNKLARRGEWRVRKCAMEQGMGDQLRRPTLGPPNHSCIWLPPECMRACDQGPASSQSTSFHTPASSTLGHTVGVQQASAGLNSRISLHFSINSLKPSRFMYSRSSNSFILFTVFLL